MQFGQYSLNLNPLSAIYDNGWIISWVERGRETQAAMSPTDFQYSTEPLL